jgi:hypothetical protein
MPTMIATGQITIVDTNDAKPITAYLMANTGVQQVCSKDNDVSTFIPSWFAANGGLGNYLEPKVFIGGVGAPVEITHILTNRKFTLSPGGTALTSGTTSSSFVNDTGVAITNPFVTTFSESVTRLAIPGNLKDTIGQYVIYFEGDYTDVATGLVTHVIAQISLGTVKTGTNSVYVTFRGNNLIIESSGTTKNTTAITADLVRSSGVDTGNLIYKWYESNGTTIINSATAGVATKYGFKTTAGGASPTSSIGELNTNLPTGTNGNAYNTIVLAEPAVAGLNVYRVSITDTVDGGTWEGWFTIFDISDPYQVTIVSSTGDKLQNGQGNTVLTPTVYNGSILVSSLTGWSFDWFFYERTGKRAAFVDTSKISTAGGAPITVNTTGNSAVFTYTGTPYVFTAGQIIKAVKPDGTPMYYEVASSSGNTVTIRTPSTNTWLSYTNYPAPSSSSDFVGGKLFGCVGSRTTSGSTGITVTGDEIDVKGTISVEATRP